MKITVRDEFGAMSSKVKEITLEEIYDAYFKYKHNYLGYDIYNIREKYFSINTTIKISDFRSFVYDFKYFNYRVL